MLLLPRQQIISRHKASRHHDAAIKGKTRGNHRQEKAGEPSEQRQESARRSPKRRRARRRGGGCSVDVFADFGTGTEVGGSGRGGRGEEGGGAAIRRRSQEALGAEISVGGGKESEREKARRRDAVQRRARAECRPREGAAAGLARTRPCMRRCGENYRPSE